MSRFAMFHSTRKTDQKRLKEPGNSGTSEFIACETSIEKYNKCVQTEFNTLACSKFIFDEDFAAIVVKDSKWWGDSWCFTLPGPPIKNKLKTHIPF